MSTSDRALLEMAAKAAGIGPVIGFAVEPCELMIGPRAYVRYWRPLKDDGDALRLAVKLKLEIYFFDGFSEVVAEHNTASFEPGREQYAEDMNAATRRAIVRAAAEIGRSMP